MGTLLAVAIGAKLIARGEPVPIASPESGVPLPDFVEFVRDTGHKSSVIDDSVPIRGGMQRIYAINMEYLDLIRGEKRVVAWHPVEPIQFRQDEIEERDTLWALPPERKHLA